MNRLQEWWNLATPEQKKELADAVGTSTEALRLTARGYRTDGELNLNAENAARIEEALASLPRTSLPEIRREHLCRACSVCPYQLKCNE